MTALQNATRATHAAASRAHQPPSVAVIDIGSNSIKTLIARRAPTAPAQIEALFSRSINVRLSAGAQWQEGRPTLAPQAMEAALRATQELLSDAAPYSPQKITLIGTSALRDAANAAEFTALVRAQTGHAIRILSGAEEAALIGRGLLCDPALKTHSHAYAFDLGGGSLECLKLRGGQVATALSLPLGSVRLMARCVANPTAALAPNERAEIRAHVTQVFTESGFTLDLPMGAPLIGTGGLWFNVRTLLATHAKQEADAAARAKGEAPPAELAPPWITRAQVEQILELAAALPLAKRLALAGIAAGRADILPVALTTMLTLLDLGQWPGLHHSAYNLRYGLAASLL